MAAPRKKKDTKTGSKAKRPASAAANAKRPAPKKARAKKTGTESGPTTSVKKKAAKPPAAAPKATKTTAARRSSTRQLEPAATGSTNKAHSKPEAGRRKSVAAKAATFDRKWLRGVRAALVDRRDEMLSVVQSTKAQMAQRGGDLADVSDRASEGFEDELAVGLMAIEAAQLEDVEGAIHRIDHGRYGLCEDCEKPIPRKRLEVLPFARRCLACEGTSERMVRTHSPADAESDNS